MNSPRRVLVMDLALLGDLVLGLRVNRALQQLPDPPRSHWVVNAAYTGLVAGQPGVAGVQGIPKYKSRLKGLLAGAGFARRVRPDLTLVMHDSFYAALMARFGGGYRIGYDTEGRGWLLSERVAPTTGEHLWRRREALLEKALGVTAPAGPWLSVLPSWQEALPSGLPERFAVVNVHASWPGKCYPVEQFAEALALFREKEPGLPWLAIGAPDEVAKIEALREKVPWVRDAGRISITALAALLQRAALLLTNDTGPMHLAQSVGTPVVALFGATDPARSGPVGGIHEVLTQPVPCGPCYKIDCPNPKAPAEGPGFLACLTGIAPQRVAAACGDLLRR